MLLLLYLKFTPFSFEEIQCKRKTFSLAVFFCRWYISSETILRYWFSWKVSIKVLSCTSLVSNLSNKSNKIFPYDLISLFQTVQFMTFVRPIENNFRTAGKYKHWLKIWQMKWIVWQFNTSIQHQIGKFDKIVGFFLPVSRCPALMWRLLIPNHMVPNITVPICWNKSVNITYFIVHLFLNPYIAFYTGCFFWLVRPKHD